MGRAGGMQIGFWWERQKDRDPIGKPGHIQDNSIKMNLREMDWCGMDWIHLAQNRNK
jgi:hypothetical protein